MADQQRLDTVKAACLRVLADGEETVRMMNADSICMEAELGPGADNDDGRLADSVFEEYDAALAALVEDGKLAAGQVFGMAVFYLDPEAPR